MLAQFLESKGKQVLTTFEPTDNEIGTKIRQILREHRQIDMKDLQKMYCADREQHLKEVINPAIEKETVVLCDRYHFSTVAFGMLETSKDFLIDLGKDFRKPDITILLDIDPEVAMTRIDKRGEKKELFEKIEKMKKVRQNYLSPKDQPNFFIVDGNREPLIIAEDIKNLISKFL